VAKTLLSQVFLFIFIGILLKLHSTDALLQV